MTGYEEWKPPPVGMARVGAVQLTISHCPWLTLGARRALIVTSPRRALHTHVVHDLCQRCGALLRQFLIVQRRGDDEGSMRWRQAAGRSRCSCHASASVRYRERRRPRIA